MEIISNSAAYQAAFDIVFVTGPRLHQAAIFFNTGTVHASDLAERLGSDIYRPKGHKMDNDQQMTNIPGLYLAGDASRDVLQVIVAAAEGAKAAIGINNVLMSEDLS